MKEAESVNKADLIKILEEVSEGIYITDGKAKTLFVNKSYERISGAKRDMFIGKYMEDVVKQKLIDESATLKVLAEKSEITMVQTLSNKKTVLITASPIYNDRKEINMVVTILRDLTSLNKIKNDIDAKKKRINKLVSMLEKDGDLVYRSESMKEVVNKAIRASKYDTTILINGETGVGKDLVAKLIAKQGIRKDKVFIEVNCTAIPDSLMESEFFGYEPGSFTGALKNGKKGIFELAHGGTLFLDEIGDISQEMQTKLLKVIQYKKFHRVGGYQDIQADVNIISATNKNLYEMVKEGSFREDLYYRLNVIPIYIPPLRKRQEDVLVLIEYFLNDLINIYGEEKHFSNEALKILYEYKWPGNIRELKNLIERTYILSNNETIEEYQLPISLRQSDERAQLDVADGMKLNDLVENLEIKVITQALKKSKNNKEAAKILGIDPSTLTRKRQKYSI